MRMIRAKPTDAYIDQINRSRQVDDLSGGDPNIEITSFAELRREFDAFVREYGDGMKKLQRAMRDPLAPGAADILRAKDKNWGTAGNGYEHSRRWGGLFSDIGFIGGTLLDQRRVDGVAPAMV